MLVLVAVALICMPAARGQLVPSVGTGAGAGAAAVRSSPRIVYAVFGAGVTEVNGNYLQTEMLNGAWQFIKVGDKAANKYRLQSNKEFSTRVWVLRVDDDQPPYYWATTEATEVMPPTTGWRKEFAVGKLPVPHVEVMAGTCTLDGHCSCAVNHFGEHCQLSCNATLHCSGHGACETNTGLCKCFQGFSGPNCTHCGAHGTWGDGACQCPSQYIGPECSEIAPGSRWKLWLWFTAQDYAITAAAAAVVIAATITCCCFCKRGGLRKGGKAAGETKHLLANAGREGKGKGTHSGRDSKEASSVSSRDVGAWTPKTGGMGTPGSHDKADAARTPGPADDFFGESVTAVYSMGGHQLSRDRIRSVQDATSPGGYRGDTRLGGSGGGVAASGALAGYRGGARKAGPMRTSHPGYGGGSRAGARPLSTGSVPPNVLAVRSSEAALSGASRRPGRRGGSTPHYSTGWYNDPHARSASGSGAGSISGSPALSSGRGADPRQAARRSRSDRR